MTTQIQEIEAITDVVEDLFPYEEDNGEHLAHIVMPPGNEHVMGGIDVTAKEIIETARITGQEVQALCGYRWVPVRDPGDKEICQGCLDVFNEIFGGE